MGTEISTHGNPVDQELVAFVGVGAVQLENNQEAACL